MDSADLLREKSAIILQSFFKEIPRDPFSWLDIVQKLGQTVSSGEIVTRDDLSLVLDLLQNPGSELYMNIAPGGRALDGLGGPKGLPTPTKLRIPDRWTAGGSRRAIMSGGERERTQSHS